MSPLKRKKLSKIRLELDKLDNSLKKEQILLKKFYPLKREKVK